MTVSATLNTYPHGVDAFDTAVTNIVGGFLLDPFLVGRLMPIAERFAYWHRLPLYEKFLWGAEFSRILKRTGATKKPSPQRRS